MTGGAFGYCGGNDAPGYGAGRGSRFAGRGSGLYRGRGGRGLNLRRRFFRRWRFFGVDPLYARETGYFSADEAELLRREAQDLQASLEQINKRLSELEKQDKKEKVEKVEKQGKD
jgi:hypothetical protein